MGFVSPLLYQNGSAYLKLRPYTGDEYDILPHVIMTSDKIWDPLQFDLDGNTDIGNLPILIDWRLEDYNLRGEHIRATHDDVDDDDSSLEDFVSSKLFEDGISTLPDDKYNDIEFWVDAPAYDHSEGVNRCMCTAFNYKLTTSPAPRTHNAAKQDSSRLKSFFAWIPTYLIKHTFKNSTHHEYMPASSDGNQFVRWHAPNPALNVFCLNDNLLSNEIHLDTPALDKGYLQAQI